MRRTISLGSALPAAVALAAVLTTAGCGNEPEPKADDKPSAAEVDTSAGEGDWLLGMTAAGGADGETTTTTYLTYNPSTGETTARRLPPVQAGSASGAESSLLVSSDRRWSIPDTGISRAAEKSGKLTVHSLTDTTTTVLDIRERAGTDDILPVAWAFDPSTPDTLRVVDTANRVWQVEVSGGKATQESTLPEGNWFFTNGFDSNTGEPWVESIENDETLPPGHGAADKDPITRSGGTVLPGNSAGYDKLPKSPCRFGAGFTEDNGLTWVFCADKPTVQTYYLPKGETEWTAYGKPSKPLAPEAADFPVVLPPAE